MAEIRSQVVRYLLIEKCHRLLDTAASYGVEANELWENPQ